MRAVAGCVLVAALGVFLPQSSQELHSRYGQPDMERFTARPGIALAVQYGSDHLICEALIEPPQTLIHREQSTQLMSSDGVPGVLEEIAPAAMRGKEIRTGSFQASCGVGNFTEYENVLITRGMYACDTSSRNRDSRTEIIFKRDICPQPKTPWILNRP
jgi:hypothetical protein